MLRRLILFLCLIAPVGASAQSTLRFGFFSYEEVFKSMPDYARMQSDMASLRAKYEAETKRAEDEFNKKYEEFLEGQREFEPSILKKRQAELQDLMSRNVKFRQESDRLLRQAEQDARQPLHEKITRAANKVGSDLGYAFILNTDGHAVPYINVQNGEDVTALVKEALAQ